MITNVDPSNGIHFGVIPKNDLFNCAEEFYDNAEDESHKKLIKEMRESIIDIVSQQINDWGVGIEKITSLEELLDEIEQLINDRYENDCANMVYERDGYIIAGSNDDTDLFIIKSPYYTIAPLCSPCAPNAGYLKNALTTDNLKEASKAIKRGHVITYCLEDDWFEGDKAPYRYKKVGHVWA